MESKIGTFRYSCKFPNCNCRYYSPVTDPSYKNKRFHTFPKQKSLRKKWKQVCNIEKETNVDHMYICCDHFLNLHYRDRNCVRLTWDAVPCFTEKNVELDVTLSTGGKNENSIILQNEIENMNWDEQNLDLSANLSAVQSVEIGTSATVEIVTYENVGAVESVQIETPETVEIETSGRVQNLNLNINSIHSDRKDDQNLYRCASVQNHNSDLNSIIQQNETEIDNILNEHSYCAAPTDRYDPFEGQPALLEDVKEILSISEQPVDDTKIFNDISSKENVFPVHIKRKRNARNLNSFISESGASKSNRTPREEAMYKIHRKVTAKLCKLQEKLKNQRNVVQHLEYLHKQHLFAAIDKDLNEITKNFIHSQLRNCSQKPSARRWTVNDKIFALSIFKRSPKLYRHLCSIFILPSTRLLKAVSAKIPFEPGINIAVVQELKRKCKSLKKLDRNCVLLMDEAQLAAELSYESHNQKIIGFEDLGHLGRSIGQANHALVFMVRGVRKKWKQVVAYYFTKNTISTDSLKALIVKIISELQECGFNVMSTVCDQGPTNKAAVHQLCDETAKILEDEKIANVNSASDSSENVELLQKSEVSFFLVNEQPVVLIFDVPHLLKCLRNAMLKCDVVFDTDKVAKFEYIQTVFELDQRKEFKTLKNLEKEYFDFKQSWVKMKVRIAAAQLSSSVASEINTYVRHGKLPAEAIFTSEFIHLIDTLFDYLNGSTIKPDNINKKLRCSVSNQTFHVQFWTDMIDHISKWRFLENGKDVTNRFHFIQGWLITIRSMIHIWNNVNRLGFSHLNPRNFNQDPLENLFCLVRQHSTDRSPTCQHFTGILKTVVLTNLSLPESKGNCENDDCSTLGSLRHFVESDTTDEDTLSPNIEEDQTQVIQLNSVQGENKEGLGLEEFANSLLIDLPIKNCISCKSSLFSFVPTVQDILLQNCDTDYSSTNASDKVKVLIKNISDKLKSFLDIRGHVYPIEDIFISAFRKEITNDITFCCEHLPENLVINKCVKQIIYDYIQSKKPKNIPKEHKKSAKQLNKMQVFAKSSLSHVQKTKFDCRNKNDTNLKIESNTKESRPAKPHINSIKIGNVSAEYIQQLKSYANPNSSIQPKITKLRYDSIPNSYVKRKVLSLRNDSIEVKRRANKISKENIDSIDIEKKCKKRKIVQFSNENHENLVEVQTHNIQSKVKPINRSRSRKQKIIFLQDENLSFPQVENESSINLKSEFKRF